MEFTRKRSKDNFSIGFILGCVLDYNFRSFRRFLIYLLHYTCVIDLRKTPSDEISDAFIARFLDAGFNIKVPKARLRSLVGLSPNTFNKVFKDYLEDHRLEGRRVFSITEAYYILEYWQGEGTWGRLKAIPKKKLAVILHKGNYHRASMDSKYALGEEGYKDNLLTPRSVKRIMEHLDITQEDLKEKLMGYNEFKSYSIRLFTIYIIAMAFKNTCFFGKKEFEEFMDFMLLLCDTYIEKPMLLEEDISLLGSSNQVA